MAAASAGIDSRLVGYRSHTETIYEGCQKYTQVVYQNHDDIHKILE